MIKPANIVFINISTHTPLAGRDFKINKILLTQVISTHTPLAGRDITSQNIAHGQVLFQLTRPSRGVTEVGGSGYVCNYISTHTPLAGRDRASGSIISSLMISTHTPLAGRDLNAGDMMQAAMTFQLTRPSRGVTK